MLCSWSLVRVAGQYLPGVALMYADVIHEVFVMMLLLGSVTVGVVCGSICF